MIWAQARGGAIGVNNTLPWSVPEDMALFRRITRGCSVIMGKNTWNSLPERFRPLPGRKNIILSRTLPAVAHEDVFIYSSLDDVLTFVDSREIAWVMGGAHVYEQCINRADILCVTDIDIDVPDADAFAPRIPDDFHVVQEDPSGGWNYSEKGKCSYRFRMYARDALDVDIASLPSL